MAGVRMVMATKHEHEVRVMAERLRSMAAIHTALRGPMLDSAEALDFLAGELYGEGCKLGSELVRDTR